MKIIYYIENNSGIVVSIFFKVSIKYLLLMNFLCSHSHKLLLNIPDSNSIYIEFIFQSRDPFLIDL